MPKTRTTASDTKTNEKPRRATRRKGLPSLNPYSKKKKSVALSRENDGMDEQSKTTAEQQFREMLSSGDERSDDTTSDLTTGEVSNRKAMLCTSLSSEVFTSTNRSAFPSHLSPLKEEGVQVNPHRNLLHQQTLLLSTNFSLHDCPEMKQMNLGQKRTRGHIPQGAVDDVLKKLNNKMVDEVQKYLNRQFQRKVLDEVFGIEKETLERNYKEDDVSVRIKETKSVPEILDVCPEEWEDEDTDRHLLRNYSKIRAELKETDSELNEVKQKVSSFKSRSHLILETERLANDAESKNLVKQLSRTKQLVGEIMEVLEQNHA